MTGRGLWIRTIWWFCLVCGVLLLWNVPVIHLLAKGRSPVLRTVSDLPLPGRATRFDYASLDPVQGKLYMAHLGDSSIVVFDVVHRRVQTVISGIPSVHGVIAVSSLEKVFATATGRNRIVFVDSRRDRIAGEAAAGVHPDGLTYDPRERLIFISDETGRSVTVVDPEKGKRVATIPMGGEVGNVRYDPVSRTVYAAVQTRNEIVSINPVTFRVQRRIRVDTGCHPHGLRIDQDGRMAYVACQFSAKLLLLDLVTQHILGRFGVGSDPDVLVLDPVRHRLVVASESGTVSVFFHSGSRWRKAGDQFVGFRSHTVAVDPKTGLFYFPLENEGGTPKLKIMSFQSE
ncbi:MAG: YncE family protein [Leptospirales bacterium]